MRIASIVGARPQFVKASVVSREIRRTADEILIHTGQHYDYCMSQAFFEELDIPEPDYNLGIGSATQGAQTGQMLAAIEEVLLREKPDVALVYGDTNSTLAGALAAAKLHVPVCHVEAGLRSFNRQMPEEVNRILTDHISTLLFAPTATAVKNLTAEGVSEGVFLTGDVMYDAVLAALEPATKRADGLCEKLGVEPKKYILATIHRAGNTDHLANLAAILEGLHVDFPVIFLCHPRTRSAIERAGFALHQNVRVLEPLCYVDTVALQMHAAAIATDSGGMQKEAYILGVPCVTLREETEWVETVAQGWNVLVGADTSVISERLRTFRPTAARDGLFGDGHAAEKIAKALMEIDHEPAGRVKS